MAAGQSAALPSWFCGWNLTVSATGLKWRKEWQLQQDSRAWRVTSSSTAWSNEETKALYLKPIKGKAISEALEPSSEVSLLGWYSIVAIFEQSPVFSSFTGPCKFCTRSCLKPWPLKRGVKDYKRKAERVKQCLVFHCFKCLVCKNTTQREFTWNVVFPP